jgi:hypothetical protein
VEGRVAARRHGAPQSLWRDAGGGAQYNARVLSGGKLGEGKAGLMFGERIDESLHVRVVVSANHELEVLHRYGISNRLVKHLATPTASSSLAGSRLSCLFSTREYGSSISEANASFLSSEGKSSRVTTLP